MYVPSPYEESILVSLRRITRAIDLHSRALARDHELTVPQLVCLRQLERDGETSPTVLAKRVSLSQATVTGIIERLHKRGLVAKSPSREDKRRVYVGLTGRGRKAIRSAPSPLSDQFRSRLEHLHDGEQAMIDWILARVVTMMEADDVDASPLMTTGPVDAKPDDVVDFLEPEDEDA